MKKILSLILTIMMLLSLTIASNADGNTIERDSSWKITATDNMEGQPPTFAFDKNRNT